MSHLHLQAQIFYKRLQRCTSIWFCNLLRLKKYQKLYLVNFQILPRLFCDSIASPKMTTRPVIICSLGKQPKGPTHVKSFSFFGICRSGLRRVWLYPLSKIWRNTMRWFHVIWRSPSIYKKMKSCLSFKKKKFWTYLHCKKNEVVFHLQ